MLTIVKDNTFTKITKTRTPTRNRDVHFTLRTKAFFL